MSAETSIEWTDSTWNPTRGCSRISEGCRHCYAESIAARFAKPGMPFDGFAKVTAPRDLLDRTGGRRNGWTGKVELIEQKLFEPLSWRAPRKIFVNSMSDLFHEALPDEAIDRVYAVMALAPHHVFQVLTKRADRMQAYFAAPDLYARILLAANDIRAKRPELCSIGISDPAKHPPRWIWLGVSVEDRLRRPRIDFLRGAPAAVRFLSIEPLLEDMGRLDLTGIGWVIVGGESGQKARRFNVRWARNIVRQCRDAGVPVFVKQLGRHVIDRNDAGFEDGYRTDFQGADVRVHLRDKKGGDQMEWPPDLRVRQWPDLKS